MKIILIAAIGNNRELGKDGDLIWKIPDDMYRFKVLTRDKMVIVGRKTFETLPQPLKRRETLVISSRDKVEHADHVFKSVPEALDYAESRISNEVYIIGGEQIYKECLYLSTELSLTMIDSEDKEADTFFPKFENLFYQRQSTNMEHEELKYRFTRWSLKD